MAKLIVYGLLVLALFNFTAAKKDLKIVCYYTNWSQYRHGCGQFFPEDIDPQLCTHVIFSFAKVTKDGDLEPYEWNDMSTPWSKGLYERTVDLKSKNPDLKVLLAVGGWNHGSLSFSQMVNNQVSRRNFVYNAVQFLKNNSFSGLDLDWEYPANRDSKNVKDKQFFTVLCQELNKAFKPHGLLLTAAVGAGKPVIDSAYEISKISRYLHFINLMAYDLHGSWDNATGINAPLYARKNDSDQTLNVAWAAEYYVKNGAPAEKLVIGLGAYGRSFTLTDPNKHDLDAHTCGAGLPGQSTMTEGFLAYYEICEKLQKGWTRVWDDESKVPYAYSGNQWVGYDDAESLTEKNVAYFLQAKFILKNGFGGGMFWAVDLDDFKGTQCDEGPYPLINAVKDVFEEELESEPDTAPPTSTYYESQAKEKESLLALNQYKPVNFEPLKIISSLGNSNYPASAVPKAPTNNKLTAVTTTPSIVKPIVSPLKPILRQDPPPAVYECPRGEGYYADKSTGCRSFYRCVSSGSGSAAFTIYQQACPANLLFDEKISSCNFPSQVTCFN